MSEPIPADQWEWFGTAGHLIVSQWCRFHLATKVGEYLVSTVGQYVPPEGVQTILALSRGYPLTETGDARELEWLRKNGWERLGAWGTYETMVFLAGPPCEGDFCGCGVPAILNAGQPTESRRYDNARDATRGHYDFCMAAAGHPDAIQPK